MNNISNLDFKRHQLGLVKDLSVFSILEHYKKLGFKNKLECIAIITVIKSIESNYQEALRLIFKYEGVTDTESLLNKLNKLELESKIVIAREKELQPPIPDDNSNLTVDDGNTNSSLSSFFNKNKFPVIGAFFVLVVISFFISNADNNDPPPSQVAISNPTEVINKQEQFIPLEERDGHKHVKILINNSTATFLLDTGASTTLISYDFLNELIEEGFIVKESNFIGSGRFKIADGSSVKGEVWRLPFIRIGAIKLSDVEVVALQNIKSTDYLLGMSTLKKLGNYTIVPNENKIIIKN